jgi:hypothetical protein
MVRPIVPPKGGRDGQHRAVGVELAHRLGQPVLQVVEPGPSIGSDRLRRRAGEGLLGGSRSSVSTMVMMAAMPGLRLAPRPSSSPTRACASRTADEAAGCGPDGDRGEHRRRREADEHADAATPAHALAAEVVAGLGDATSPSSRLLDQDGALAADLLGPDAPHQLVEVLLSSSAWADSRPRRPRSCS